eukprot:1574254-Rhodomonas_salina.1
MLQKSWLAQLGTPFFLNQGFRKLLEVIDDNDGTEDQNVPSDVLRALLSTSTRCKQGSSALLADSSVGPLGQAKFPARGLDGSRCHNVERAREW